MKIGTTKKILMILMAIVMVILATACNKAPVDPTQPTLAPENSIATVDPATGETPEPTATPDPLEALKFWNVDPDKRVYNILLLGLDELEGTAWARNDTTMILQINLDNNELKLVSFMRDMYVDIPSQGPYRLNNAHYRGGPELAIQTMKSVFDVDIDYYATVDFIAFERIMKIIGPVVIRIMDYEMEHINKLESAVSIDNDPMSGSIQNPGLNEINEYQALSYARDRHSSGDDNERAGDYGRNERQREIVKAAWTKVKSNQLVAIPAAVFAASVYAETNISPKLLITLLQTMMENNAEMIDMAIPVEGKFWAAWIEEDTKTKYSSDELFDKYESEKEKFEEDQADDSASSGSGDPSPTPAPAPTPAATQEDKQEFPSYETWRLRKGYASVIDWSQKNINALHEFLGSN